MNQSFSFTAKLLPGKLMFILLFIPSFIIAQNDPNEHIYQPERLVLKKDTMTVSGTVLYVLNELDGDYHIRLRMDSDYVKLSKKNFTRQDSCIILEIVCGHQAIFPISCKCAGYDNKIAVPVVGMKVMVTGRLVYDRRHKWTELHPIYEMHEEKQIPQEIVRTQNVANTSR